MFRGAFTLSFHKAIYRRQDLGINSICLYLGPRGAGKSYGSMRVAESFDPTFNIDRVTFNVKDFMSVINKLKEQNLKWPWCVFDEAGMDTPARKWLSQANMVISLFSQSSRYTQINVGICTPDPSLVDLHIRTLSDFWIVLKARGRGTVYTTRSNPFSKKFTTPILCPIKLSLPSKSLYEAYEKKREKAMSTFYEGYEQELEQKSLREEHRRRDLLSEAKECIEDLLSDSDPQIIDYKKVIVKLNVSQSKAYDLKYQLEDLIKENEL